jgi:hypothetical protein
VSFGVRRRLRKVLNYSLSHWERVGVRAYSEANLIMLWQTILAS